MLKKVFTFVSTLVFGLLKKIKASFLSLRDYKPTVLSFIITPIACLSIFKSVENVAQTFNLCVFFSYMAYLFTYTYIEDKMINNVKTKELLWHFLFVPIVVIASFGIIFAIANMLALIIPLDLYVISAIIIIIFAVYAFFLKSKD